jgi:hypothetical protein
MDDLPATLIYKKRRWRKGASDGFKKELEIKINQL